ncbi:hypothetical protein [Methanoculleus sp.]|uniref:hypothetical protein n=1 Tax=Methanoculleus sp. TaxID=90427 RepID=UPI001BD427AF|nr:hypothetical protein [Methanoculleus sp.]
MKLRAVGERFFGAVVGCDGRDVRSRRRPQVFDLRCVPRQRQAEFEPRRCE